LPVQAGDHGTAADSGCRGSAPARRAEHQGPGGLPSELATVWASMSSEARVERVTLPVAISWSAMSMTM
jgi:hypothetical protein